MTPSSTVVAGDASVAGDATTDPRRRPVAPGPSAGGAPAAARTADRDADTNTTDTETTAWDC